MPTRICGEPGCPNPATARGRCATHAQQADRTIQRAGKQIYRTARWKQTRRHILFSEPLCKCGRVATDVHHRTDLAHGGSPYDPANLEPLCRSCHSQITRQHQMSACAS